ncbi:MAG: TonB-dependent receptor [Phenylobacterium sp.]
MKRFWLASSALALSVGASAAAAQDRAAAVEEVIVTAEKRAQNLQDVPVAVTAFTGERRDRLGILSVQDLTNFTPGLQYSTQLDRAYMRGAGRYTSVQATEGAVAIYSDGVYTSTTLEAGKPPIFTDRIEVLRGPQGTLYGRNAIGGAINIISERPTDDWYAEVRGLAANYERYSLQGAVSGPTLIPGVTFRLTGSWEKQSKGWIDNIVPNMPDEGNVIDSRLIEGQLSWKPNDRFDGWVRLLHIEQLNGGGGPGSRNTWTPAPFPTYAYASGAFSPNAGYGCQPGALATNIVNASPAGCVNPALTDPRKIATTVPFDTDLDRAWYFASEWNYHFDHMLLKYVFGADQYNYNYKGSTPVDQTAPIIAYTLGGVQIRPRQAVDYTEDLNWFSHEVNLSSTDEGPLNWLVGAYYFSQDYRQPVFTELPDQAQVAGPFASPATFCARTGGVCAPNPDRRLFDSRPESETISKAVYGQIDWEFVPAWTVTLGLRYNHDRKSGVEQARVICFSAPTCVPIAGVAVDVTQQASVLSAPTPAQGLAPGVTSFTTYDPATGLARRTFGDSWSATTGTAGLQWQPDSDTLAYARYSRGYKAGGFRIGVDTAFNTAPRTEAESADAYELGLKKTFLDGRLQANLALFHTTTENTQIPLTIASTSGLVGQSQSIFYNIPEARTQGFELESIWQATEAFQLSFTYAYLDAEITRSSPAVDPADPAALGPGARPVVTTTSTDVFTAGLPGGGFQRAQNLDGNRLPHSPQNKVAVNANYTWDLSIGQVTASASYIWRDEQYGHIFTRDVYKSPSFDQVDARLMWSDPDNKRTVIAYVRNLFDELGYEGGASAVRRAGFLVGPTGALVPVLQGVSTSYPLTPPRTFGVELQYRFY